MLDFDGTMILSSKVETLCRKIIGFFGFDRPPKTLLVLGEMIDLIRFVFLGGAKKIKINSRIINLIKKENLPFGILTDRSKCSLCMYLKYMKINTEKIVFIQARKSIFDFLHTCNNDKTCRMVLSEKIKPDPLVYRELLNFIEKIGLEPNDVLIVDDLHDARKTAEKIGFLTLNPTDLN